MIRTQITKRPKRFPVSIVRRTKSVRRRKSLHLPSEISVTKVRILSNNSITPKHEVIREIDEIHGNRLVIQSKMRSPIVIKQSMKTNETQKQIKSNKPVISKISKLNRKRMRKKFKNKNHIQRKTRRKPNSIYKNIDSDSNENNKRSLSISSNYRKNRWFRPTESMSLGDYDKFQNQDITRGLEQEYQNDQYLKFNCRSCPTYCIILLVFGGVLLLAGFAVICVFLAGLNKTTTTSSLTMTTTPLTCIASCLNQSWIDPSGELALWTFDGSFDDVTGAYNGSIYSNSPAFAVGYFDQAALFNASADEAIYTSSIPLDNVSFTIEAWIKPTGYPNPSDHSIVGMCDAQNTSYCLQISIRNTSLYFGFFNDDLRGTTTIALDQWIHVAFVFDVATRTQSIYLNGVQDAQRISSQVLLVQSGNFTIGTNDLVAAPANFFEGYIDQLSINQRAKSACEILERATLAAHFKFDNSSSYTDSGPNTVSTTFSNTSIINGYRNQAISLNGTLSSYFQTWGFTSLGMSNQAFSITMWIRPEVLSGTLVHLSSSSAGTGSACFPLLGFASNGAIIAQVLTTNTTMTAATGPILSVSSSWAFIVQTWSSTNGLKLYVNNTLVSSVSAPTFLGSETTPNYLTLGNCLNGCNACVNGSISGVGPFSGTVDDWRIYDREITSNDICVLYSTT